MKSMILAIAVMLPVVSQASAAGLGKPLETDAESGTAIYLLGGAGAVEAVFCVRALETGVLPPTINLTDPDPACDLDYVANEARKSGPAVVMSNSFGFGGHNATLVLGRADR